jgi:hypothetical protein
MATAAIAASSSGDNALVAAVTGKKIRVHAYELSASGAVNAKFRSGTTDVTGLIYLAAAGSSADGVEADKDPDGLFETAVSTALNLNLSGAVAVGGFVDYSLE